MEERYWELREEVERTFDRWMADKCESNLQTHKEALERFYLECDLGCDKEKFFEMVVALNFDNV